jgi:hypothetical protein
MKERFIDPDTGWAVTRETVVYPRSPTEVIEETVTDPLTGEVYRSSRVPSCPCTIAEWVEAIQETKELITESERRRKQRARQVSTAS